MAFSIRNLSVLAYANGFTLWHYKSSDPQDQVDTPGYFDTAYDMLTVGDIMMVSSTGSGALRVVTPSGGSNVVMSRLVA